MKTWASLMADGLDQPVELDRNLNNKDWCLNMKNGWQIRRKRSKDRYWNSDVGRHK